MNLQDELLQLLEKHKNQPSEYPYNIYSGFCRNTDKNKYAGKDADEWFDVWVPNTRKVSQAPIFTVGPHVPNNPNGTTSIINHANLGHYDDQRHDYFHGCTAGFLVGLIHAYCNRKDFILKEQDCLWFGDCVKGMYDVGSPVALGNNKLFSSATSLFLIKWVAIPDALKSIVATDCDTRFPEAKIKEIVGAQQYSFGYDRDRPFETDKLPFYLQQITKEDFKRIEYLL